MKNKIPLTVALFLITLFGFAQTAQSKFNSNSTIDNIVLTWNATTPEQEMKDDIKALVAQGVTVRYSNVKRNDKNEIIRITINFDATTGDKGSLSYSSKKPIPTIKIYKYGEEVGFGEPTAAEQDYGFASVLNDSENQIYGLQYNFNPNGRVADFKSTTVITRPDRHMLEIEDGVVVAGGYDYTKEEIEQILKEQDDTIGGKNGLKQFNYRGNKDFSNTSQQILRQLDELEQSEEKSNENKEKQQTEEVEKSKNPTDKPKLKVKKV